MEIKLKINTIAISPTISQVLELNNPKNETIKLNIPNRASQALNLVSHINIISQVIYGSITEYLSYDPVEIINQDSSEHSHSSESSHSSQTSHSSQQVLQHPHRQR